MVGKTHPTTRAGRQRNRYQDTTRPDCDLDVSRAGLSVAVLLIVMGAFGPRHIREGVQRPVEA